jgi:hypothetical protein
MKLQDGDIFVLVTRGIWERVDTWDVKSAIDDSADDPQLALVSMERLLLDPHAAEIDNYTAAAVYVDKVFIDPNRSKKIRSAVAAGVAALVVASAVTVLLVVSHNKTVSARHEMETAFLNAVEYVEGENYPRASQELDTALSLSESIKDRDFHAKSDGWKKLVEAVMKADDLFASASYDDAQSAYLVAKDRSRFSDGAGIKYIERKLALVGGFLSVRDLIAMGDVLAVSGNYSQAADKYASARQLASGINDSEGRKLALAAMEDIYKQQDRDESQLREAAAQGEKTLGEAANMESSGDEAVAAEDLYGAKLYYTISRERFTSLQDGTSVSRIDRKLSAVEDKIAKNDQQAAVALQYAREGDAYFDQGDYINAKTRYILARGIYSRLQNEAGLADVMSKMDMCDNKLALVREKKNQDATGATTAAVSLTRDTPAPPPIPVR